MEYIKPGLDNKFIQTRFFWFPSFFNKPISQYENVPMAQNDKNAKRINTKYKNNKSIMQQLEF
jgi:hypothetical protein